ncbi:hypothetical protein GcM3_100023 [Golovinomyces cichoracearum]|uniref:Uncharacterized protein n=1 Tax=Golovinomyces cichoracearum TaxID=62708 RepID=A0A420IAC3_9PEZI|nr:hypothetical protein GcM3_100023 [Golovinomyces cichoracearum]
MPADLKDLVPRYMGNTYTKIFFNVIIMRVGGDALEVLEQNRRMVACMNDSSCATDDDVVACKDLLMTQFAPVEIEQENDWMAELGSFRQEKTETLTSYYNRAVVLMKNIKLLDKNQDGLTDRVENTPTEKHLLKTLCMAYYMGFNDPVLKRDVFQLKGWSKCSSLLQMHTLVTEEKNDMEQQARVKHELKNAECIQMLKYLQAGSITQADMNTFMAAMGPTSSSSSNITISSPRTHLLTGVTPISNRDRWNPTHIDSSQSNPNHQLQQPQKSRSIRPKNQRNYLYNSRQDRNQTTKSQNSSVPNYQAPNQRKIETPVGYDRSTSSNPFVNGSKIMNVEQVCLLCGSSGNVAVRGDLNCSPGARKLDLIKYAIICSFLFPNDRNVEANMTFIRSRYYNDNFLNTSSISQQTPQFIPDNLDSHMFQCSDQTTSHSQSPGTTKNNYLSNDLERVDVDVFGYEPAGSKRVRIYEDDDSEDEFEKVKRTIKANEREQFERQSRRQKKEKERKVLETISDTTQRNLNSKSIPKASISFAESSKRKSETKLRNIVGREDKGPLDYKKMLENTMMIMSMMDFYQASPEFSITSQKLSTRPEEEELLVEVSFSLVKVGCHRETEPKHNEDKLKFDYLTVSSPKIPTVDLMTIPIIRTTARKDRAFHIPGKVLATRDGKTGNSTWTNQWSAQIRGQIWFSYPHNWSVCYNLKIYLDVINTQAIIMGTADGTSHRITEWVSFFFITGGIQRQICAFVRPERCPTLDLFLLLGLSWLHSVKAVIETCRSQIKIGDKSLGEISTILQGPTFEFAKAHRLLLQPTQIPFQNPLMTEQFGRKIKALESNTKESMKRANFKKSGRILDSITVDGSDYEENQAINDYKSASTDPDVSDEYEYSSDKDSEDVTGSHMGKDHVTRMT